MIIYEKTKKVGLGQMTVSVISEEDRPTVATVGIGTLVMGEAIGTAGDIEIIIEELREVQRKLTFTRAAERAESAPMISSTNEIEA